MLIVKHLPIQIYQRVHLKDATGASALSGGRFDPATFGSALMNVAREGVDRLGTPTLGSAAESTSGSPQPGEGAKSANLNENLKSFGKFFSRDGGFPRFGRGETSGSGNVR